MSQTLLAFFAGAFSATGCILLAIGWWFPGGLFAIGGFAHVHDTRAVKSEAA